MLHNPHRSSTKNGNQRPDENVPIIHTTPEPMGHLFHTFCLNCGHRAVVGPFVFPSIQGVCPLVVVVWSVQPLVKDRRLSDHQHPLQGMESKHASFVPETPHSTPRQLSSISSTNVTTVNPISSKINKKNSIVNVPKQTKNLKNQQMNFLWQN